MHILLIFLALKCWRKFRLLKGACISEARICIINFTYDSCGKLSRRCRNFGIFVEFFLGIFSFLQGKIWSTCECMHWKNKFWIYFYVQISSKEIKYIYFNIYIYLYIELFNIHTYIYSTCIYASKMFHVALASGAVLSHGIHKYEWAWKLINK